jgi:hypothetical protein
VVLVVHGALLGQGGQGAQGNAPPGEAAGLGLRHEVGKGGPAGLGPPAPAAADGGCGAPRATKTSEPVTPVGGGGGPPAALGFPWVLNA